MNAQVIFIPPDSSLCSVMNCELRGTVAPLWRTSDGLSVGETGQGPKERTPIFPGSSEPRLPLSDPFSQASGCRRMKQAILSP